MELFLDIFFFVAVSICVVANLIFLLVIRLLLKAAQKTLDDEPITPSMIAKLGEEIDANEIHVQRNLDEINLSILDLKNLIESTKPIKPNNWDGIREAFTRPTRIEENVGNRVK